MAKYKTEYTVVQHSGYVGNDDRRFAKGLESKFVATQAVANQVKLAGGLLFDSYEEAEAYCEREQYPDAEGFSMIPAAPGTFSELKVGGLPVYLPKVVTLSHVQLLDMLTTAAVIGFGEGGKAGLTRGDLGEEVRRRLGRELAALGVEPAEQAAGQTT